MAQRPRRANANIQVIQQRRGESEAAFRRRARAAGLTLQPRGTTVAQARRNVANQQAGTRRRAGSPTASRGSGS